jgi:hypothetical protein
MHSNANTLAYSAEVSVSGVIKLLRILICKWCICQNRFFDALDVALGPVTIGGDNRVAL